MYLTATYGPQRAKPDSVDGHYPYEEVDLPTMLDVIRDKAKAADIVNSNDAVAAVIALEKSRKKAAANIKAGVTSSKQQLQQKQSGSEMGNGGGDRRATSSTQCSSSANTSVNAMDEDDEDLSYSSIVFVKGPSIHTGRNNGNNSHASGVEVGGHSKKTRVDKSSSAHDAKRSSSASSVAVPFHSNGHIMMGDAMESSTLLHLPRRHRKKLLVSDVSPTLKMIRSNTTTTAAGGGVMMNDGTGSRGDHGIGMTVGCVVVIISCIRDKW